MKGYRFVPYIEERTTLDMERMLDYMVKTKRMVRAGGEWHHKSDVIEDPVRYGVWIKELKKYEDE